ncbi:hypothetical protein Tco_1294971 [Tanacetum coccineum]
MDYIKPLKLVKTASTPIETQKPLLKDEDGEEVDVHMYRSMIGSLMYLTSSRPDIMFAVCACARYQVNPKVSHLHAVKMIFRNVADLLTKAFDLYSLLLGKAKKSYKLMMEKLFRMELELMLFWSTVKAKNINEEEQLHALVDGKKIIITESSIGRDLQLADEEGIYCLPNSTIFEQLTPMGPKTTAWNEFSSTMASAIICLATNQKFNFSKFIFESMIRNLDNVSGKFLMYLRFVQVFLDQQLDGMPTHKRIYIAPSHTKKIFRNMRRVGKDFSDRVTPLFQTMMVQNQSELGKGSAILTDPHHTPTIIQPSTQPQKTQKPRKPKRKDTQVPQPSDPSENVADEAVHKELGDSLVRAATTASSLEAEQDSGNINKTQSKATPNESSSLGTTSGGGPRCQETMGDTIAQTRFENVSKHSNDSLLARGNILRSDEDRLKFDELIALCTTLQNMVLDLEKTKTTQHYEIASVKSRVKKLEKKNRSRTHKLKRLLYKVGLTARVESSDNDESLGEDASKQGRIDAIDADEEITLVSVYDVDVLDGMEVFVVEQEDAVKEVNDEVNVVEEVVEVINTAKLIIDVAQVSVAGDIVSVVSAATNNTVQLLSLMEIKSTKSKEKGIVIQELGESTTTISSQLSSQQSQGQSEFEKEERLSRERAEKEKEANIALIETWDDIQAKIDKRRKHFVAKIEEEKRNKPPTKAQKRKIIYTYLKNMEGYKLQDLKLKGFDSIQEMFERAFKRNAKKQKVEDDKETTELKQCLEIISDEEEVTIDAIPLAVKSPSIVAGRFIKKDEKSIIK